MKRFIFWYSPLWGQFSRYSKTVFANSLNQAEMKFWISDSGDNCKEILQVEEFNS